MTTLRSQTTKEEVQKLRGWSSHQYQRFLTVLIDEGKKLVYGNEYWRGYKKPENLVWMNLSVTLVMRIVENVRDQLREDDLETKTPIDAEVVKWKLLPWLRNEQKKLARQHDNQAGSARSSPNNVGFGLVRSSSYYDPVADALGRN